MKTLLAILVLLPALAWGGDFTPTRVVEADGIPEDRIVYFNDGTLSAGPYMGRIYVIPEQGAKEDGQILVPDKTGKWKNILKEENDDVVLKFEKAEPLTITIGDFHYVNELCFEMKNDRRRCVDLRWLYLLMVAQGIEEEK